MKKTKSKKVETPTTGASLADLRNQLFAMKIKKATTGLEKPAEMTKIKKEITKLLSQSKV